MRLVAVTVQKFRNFVEPQRIEIEQDVTALVGKNESGKTTVLKALHRLNPANGDAHMFDLVTEYPRWRLSRDRRNDPDIADTRPVTAEFCVEQDDIDVLAGVLPAPLLTTTKVFAARTYSNEYQVWVETDLSAVIAAAGADASVDDEDVAELLDEADLDAAIAKAKELAKTLKADAPARAKVVAGFAAAAEKYRYHGGYGAPIEQEQVDAIAARLPRFFYFSNYSLLPGEIDLTKLAKKAQAGEELSGQEQTVVSLLAHAGVAPSDFLDTNYDSRKAELQAAAVDLSREVFDYWRANTDLDVVFDDDNVPVTETPNAAPVNHRFLKIELRDGRHGNVETNFATRSTGFRWFFSFFAAFSAYLHTDKPVVVLLDEPGTRLHGDAQKDFVRYIFDELGAAKQTLYTTHSQFMVDPTVYEKLRAVQDKATRDNQGAGVEVSKVNLRADRDTVLPVESALGYSISQHLFLGSGQHLLVEGSSDFIYLMRMSAYMESRKKQALSPKLAIIPVGGINNMPAFVALMGRRLEVSVLVDGERSSSVLDRTRNAAKENDVRADRIVSIGEVDPGLPSDGDVEDLFAVVDYLKLYNWAFKKNLQESDLPTRSGRILGRIAAVDGAFKHALPAHALTESVEEFFDELDPASVSNFEKLFARLNAGVI